MVACLMGPPEVGVNFLEYLARRLGVDNLQYQEEPTAITDGWETYIFRFQLQDQPGLPLEFTRPLILRIYSSIHGLPRLRHEFAAQVRMRQLKYPVAGPVLLEKGCGLFGGPFMLMEWVSGQTLLDLMLPQPWRIIDGPGLLAEAHARLHQLPTEGFPSPPGFFLTRHLDEMRRAVEKYDLAGLKSGLDWLEKNRPDPPPVPSIIHLDFHPLNFLVQNDRCSGVLDWCEADVGDRHADIAATLVLMRSAPVKLANWTQWVLSFPGRYMLRERYLREYDYRLGLDQRTLDYYIAWAALRRLCGWGRWLRAGPHVTGSKPSIMRYLSPDRVDILRDCFRHWAGIQVQL